MKKIKLFFKNLFRKGKPCIYCGLKTTNIHKIPGSIFPIASVKNATRKKCSITTFRKENLCGF